MAKTLFFFLSFCLSLFVSYSSHPDPNPTQNDFRIPSAAHEELIKYGFPIGLLPNDVHSYSLNSSSGEFTVSLGDKCRVTLPPDNYLATYSKRITGKIVENRIAELDGINVRAFFRWWGITGIRSNGDDLTFEVGVVTAKYPSKNFNESPECEGRHSSS